MKQTKMSPASSKLTVSFYLQSLMLLYIRTVSAAENAFLFNFCSNTEANFTASGPYQKNLDKLFGILSYNAPPTGFGLGSSGLYPDKAFGLALCRGDVSPSECRSCIAGAAPEIRRRCQYNKGGVIWYDNCMLKYSGADFFGKIDERNKFYMWNLNNVTDPASFNSKTRELLNKLAKQAVAARKDKKLYAAGEMEITQPGHEFKKLYGLAQCTRDLSSETCGACLDGIINDLPNCCDGKRGGRVVTGSCNVRYEVYPFVNHPAN